MIFNIYRVAKVNEVLDSLLENNNEFADFNTLAYWQTQFNNAIAITAFISWIKVISIFFSIHIDNLFLLITLVKIKVLQIHKL